MKASPTPNIEGPCGAEDEATDDDASRYGVSYPNLPGSLLAPASSNEILDYTYPIAREMCEGATALRCHFIDTRPAFAGRPALIQIDGIHPTAEGSLVIAELIWNVMQQHCIAL